MVETKTKTAAARAKIAHKLARYYRATPVNLAGTKGTNQPSTSHLSTSWFSQLWAVPLSADSETRTIPGTLLTTRRNTSSVPTASPRLPHPGSLLFPDQLSSSFPESAREDVSLSWRLCLQATSLSLAPMPLTEFPSAESTPPMSSPPLRRSLLKASLLMSMMLSSRKALASPRTSLRTLLSTDSKRLKKESKPRPSGRPNSRESRSQLMLSSLRTSRRWSTSRDISLPVSPYPTAPALTSSSSDHVHI